LPRRHFFQLQKLEDSFLLLFPWVALSTLEKKSNPLNFTALFRLSAINFSFFLNYLKRAEENQEPQHRNFVSLTASFAFVALERAFSSRKLEI
jgi:hypothetical protein